MLHIRTQGILPTTLRAGTYYYPARGTEGQEANVLSKVWKLVEWPSQDSNSESVAPGCYGHQKILSKY